MGIEAAGGDPGTAPGCDTRLILIEGIPGSGKTSSAEWICEALRARGVGADWVPELARDHPVIPRHVMRTSRDPGYADRCAGRWRSFASSASRDSSARVQIFEACFFHGTVRFLLEHAHPEGDVQRYVDEAERAIAGLSPCILYLTQPDVRAFYRDQLVTRKGSEIVSKIAAYTETTSWARARACVGFEGMIDFYRHYRAVCDELVRRMDIPVLEIDSSRIDVGPARTRIASWLSAVGDPRR